jgi:CheY-like chemotaxis protein
VYDIRANPLKNRLNIILTGRIDAGELKLASQYIVEEAKLLKPDFASIIDFTELIPGPIEPRQLMLGLMHMLDELGMSRVVSVVRNLAAQEALSLVEKGDAELGAEDPWDTALSLQGAEKILDREGKEMGEGEVDFTKRKSVLIIDDELSLLTVLSAMMKRAGFNVYTAINGSKGIEKARLYTPDIIICDVMMPDPNGFKVQENLKQNPITASIPLIFLTARTAKADLVYALKSGADDYITKPFDRGELLARVENVLRRLQ